MRLLCFYQAEEMIRRPSYSRIKAKMRPSMRAGAHFFGLFML
jgi:hypothetical protein